MIITCNAGVNMNKCCPHCQCEKPISEFHKNKNRADGLNGWCKNCMSETLKTRYKVKRDHILQVTKLYRLNNPEKRKEICRNYKTHNKEKERIAERRRYHSNPEKYKLKDLIKRHRKRAGFRESFSIEEWKSLCRKFDFRCAACRKIDKLTVDHIVPLSKGGSNTIDNIQPLCLVCNSKKSNRTIDYRKIKRNGINDFCINAR